MKTLNIGLFGFGCVGEGLYDILKNTGRSDIVIKKICVKDLSKSRSAPQALFTDQADRILEDPGIDLIVELINGIDTAYKIVSKAITNNIPVVSANKQMIATYFDELFKLSEDNNTPFLYEGAVAGSIPIIKTLDQYYQNDKINHVSGILNGTSNYILSNQHEQDINFETALKAAQQKGFAEFDPTADIESYDPKYKLKILIAHAFGLSVDHQDILNLGISSIKPQDIAFAKSRERKIKLLAHVEKHKDVLNGFVAPVFVDNTETAYHIDQEYNFVKVDATYTSGQFLKGKGAGNYPTAIAVLSDIDHIFKYTTGYHLKTTNSIGFENNGLVEAYISAATGAALAHIPFEEEYQNYQSEGHHYQTGKISLDHLVRMNKKGLFISLLSSKIQPAFSTDELLLNEV
ncbi:MAG: homoserine dehydrogenase [Cyclobacteriaceae bacterium]